jgi:hypothetical protein
MILKNEIKKKIIKVQNIKILWSLRKKINYKQWHEQ